MSQQKMRDIQPKNNNVSLLELGSMSRFSIRNCFKDKFIGKQLCMEIHPTECFLLSPRLGIVFESLYCSLIGSYDASKSFPMSSIHFNIFFILGDKRYVCNC